jgi:hypothetical protein
MNKADTLQAKKSMQTASLNEERVLVSSATERVSAGLDLSNHTSDPNILDEGQMVAKFAFLKL